MTPDMRPAEPALGYATWYRGWECSYDSEAAIWTGDGWFAHKGGADIDAPQVVARSWGALLDEIDDQEADNGE